MRRMGTLFVLALGFLTLTAGASARTICAGGPRCPRGLQKAIDVAHPGDTVRIAAGTFRGDIHVNKSVRLQGVDDSRTIVAGGGPVLTIGRYLGVDPPTVTVADLAVEGGRSRGNLSHGIEGVGGGIFIPPAREHRWGATVTLRNVVVRGNVAAPTRTLGPKGREEAGEAEPACPHGPCPFALAAGGGIFSAGNLTLVHSKVAGNAVEGRASDADGGGIYSAAGRLRIVKSEVTGNRAYARWEQSRFAEGGGVFVNSGVPVTIAGSVIAGNGVVLKSRLPRFAGSDLIEMNANSGGVHIGEGAPARIVRAKIVRNGLRAIDRRGEPLGFDSATLVGSNVTMRAVEIAENHGFVSAATSKDSGPSGTALEFDEGGAVEDLRLRDNRFNVHTLNGSAAGVAPLATFNFEGPAEPTTLAASVIEGNQTTVVAADGPVSLFGAGVVNGGQLRLDEVSILDNVGIGVGHDAVLQGAGLWNGPIIESNPGASTLADTTITGNSLTAGGAGRAEGAIYTESPLSTAGATLADNGPEGCHGCHAVRK